jgi:hypothetical protein
VKDNNTILREAKEYSCDAIARQVGPHLPQSITYRATQWHAYGPTELHAHEIKADGIPFCFWKRSKPIPHDLVPPARAIENHGYFARATHDALDMEHAPYNVPNLQPICLDEPAINSAPSATLQSR